MARAKPPENLVVRAEGKKTETPVSPLPESSSARTVVGSGWILTGTLWLVFFAVLLLYEGYGFLKGLLRF